MARVIVFQPCSLDLRIADDAGDFSWAEPTEEVHAFANDLERTIGTQIYGRRMWEVMRFWETMPDEPGVMGDFGRVWRASDKVVVSRSLDVVDTARTELVPSLEAVRVPERRATASADLSIGGAELAGAALRAGLVDEVQLLLAPVVVGSGPRALPDGLRTDLVLAETRTFGGGWVFLRYGVRPSR